MHIFFELAIIIDTTIYLFRISKSKTIYRAEHENVYNQKGDVSTAITSTPFFFDKILTPWGGDSDWSITVNQSAALK